MALLHRVIRWVPLACSICFTSKGKSFQPASILAIKAIGCTAEERGKQGEQNKNKKGTRGRKARLLFFVDHNTMQKTEIMSIIWTPRLLASCTEKRLMSARSRRCCYILKSLNAVDLVCGVSLCGRPRESDAGRHAYLLRSWKRCINARSLELLILHRHPRVIVIYRRLSLSLFVIRAPARCLKTGLECMAEKEWERNRAGNVWGVFAQCVYCLCIIYELLELTIMAVCRRQPLGLCGTGL